MPYLHDERLLSLRQTYRNGLLEDTLPFWIKHAVDSEQGGFFTGLDQDGSVIDTDKAVWPQGRFTWLLGELYNTTENRSEWLRLARHGADFIERYCFDNSKDHGDSDGRMWFHLTRDGRPIRKRRYAFSESFAAIAFGELYVATGEEKFRRLATKCFEAFTNHDPSTTSFGPKFTDVRRTRGLAVPMIRIVTAQELRQSIELPDADSVIDEAIAEIERYHLHDDLECVVETVGQDGAILDHFDGRTLNPGHAIEGAWFILREGKHRQSAELIALGCRMLDLMWSRGWDEEHGGMLYFVDLHGLPVQEYWHDMKFWWPQCETIIATLLAYQLTNDEKYAHWHTLIHDWTHNHFPDPDHGEWFGYLHRDASISSRAKGNLWKGPFHIPRMQLICWQICEELCHARDVAIPESE